MTHISALFMLVFVCHAHRLYFLNDRVSPTRQHSVAFQKAKDLSITRREDREVIDLWYSEYEGVAKEKKRLAVIWENRRVRMGYGPKVKGGRTHKSGNNEAVFFCERC